MFIPITKIDVAKRLVYGVAADETPDRQGEIWDYATNKPLWEAWSSEAAKNTANAGQAVSLGNLRAMHGPVAAGRLDSIDFDDAAKSMAISAKVVDDSEWEKVQEGVYTGFSVGGTYTKKWPDQAIKGVRRVTIAPSEISLADLPANPSALFNAIKADGIMERRAFAAYKAVESRSDVSPKEGKDKYGDVKFADETNKKYPIDTVAHIRAAWNYINKGKNESKYKASEVAQIKARIVAAWKEKIDKGGPPSASQKTADGDAAKGMYTVATLAGLLDQLQMMQQSVEWERDMENDGSDVPERLAEAIETFAEVFMDMANEEVDELLEGISAESEPAHAA